MMTQQGRQPARTLLLSLPVPLLCALLSLLMIMLQLSISLDIAQNELFAIYMNVMTLNVVVVMASFPVGMFSTNLNMGIDKLDNPFIFWAIFFLLMCFIVGGSYALYKLYIVRAVQQIVSLPDKAKNA